MQALLNTRLAAGVLLLAAMLTGCTTARQSHTLLSTASGDLPLHTELAATPFFPQARYQCGPAALATVLGAQGLAVTPESLIDAVYIPALQGSLPEEISATARRHGRLAYPLQPSLHDLLGEIAAGHPVLVFQNLGLRWLPKWHFAVVIGYDLESGELVLRSGTTPRWRSSLATFEKTWARAGYWALVILPPGEVPASAQITRYLQAAHDLESGGNTVAAQAALQASVQRWPNDSLAWLAYGNNRYHDTDYTTAVTAFSHATNIAPDQAQGWNNLAYALLQTACPQQALHAAQCAQSLAPEDDTYRDTLSEIRRLARDDDAIHCLAVRCAAP
ncbi:MAG: PA2778 family cysteine peptidase [Gammaproteobacteria bacterium]|nr:PA2778 family cysteine peptidase [Gammaproteobacteria bacterium]